jgi:hypothetical protein
MLQGIDFFLHLHDVGSSSLEREHGVVFLLIHSVEEAIFFYKGELFLRKKKRHRPDLQRELRASKQVSNPSNKV